MKIGVLLVLLGFIVSAVAVAEPEPEPGRGWRRRYHRRYGKYRKGYPRRRIYVLRSYPYTYPRYGYESGLHGKSGELYGGLPGYQPIHTGFNGHYGYSGYGGYGGQKELRGNHFKGFGGLKGGFDTSLELGGFKGGVSGSLELKGFHSGYGKGFIGIGGYKGLSSNSRESDIYQGRFNGFSSDSQENKGYISSYARFGGHKSQSSEEQETFGRGFEDSKESKGYSSGLIQKGTSGGIDDSVEQKSFRRGYKSRVIVQKGGKRGSSSSNEHGSYTRFRFSNEKSIESTSSREAKESREGYEWESREGLKSNEGGNSAENKELRSRGTVRAGNRKGSSDSNEHGLHSRFRFSNEKNIELGLRSEEEGSHEGRRRESHEFTRNIQRGRSSGERDHSRDDYGQESKSLERTLYRSAFLNQRGRYVLNKSSQQRDRSLSTEKKHIHLHSERNFGSRESVEGRHQRQRSDEDLRSRFSSENIKSLHLETREDSGSRENGKSRYRPRSSGDDENIYSFQEKFSSEQRTGRDSGSNENGKPRDHGHKNDRYANSRFRSDERRGIRVQKGIRGQPVRYSGSKENDYSSYQRQRSRENLNLRSISTENKEERRLIGTSGESFEDSINGERFSDESRESDKGEQYESIESNRSKSLESDGSLFGGSIISIIKNFFVPKGSKGQRKNSKERSSQKKQNNAEFERRSRSSEESLRNFETRYAVSDRRGSLKLNAGESDQRKELRTNLSNRYESTNTERGSRSSNERNSSEEPFGGLKISEIRDRSFERVLKNREQFKGRRRGFKDSYEWQNNRDKSAEKNKLRDSNGNSGIYIVPRRSMERNDNRHDVKNSGRGLFESIATKSSRDRFADSYERGNDRRNEQDRADEWFELKINRQRGKGGLQARCKKGRRPDFGTRNKGSQGFRGNFDASDERKIFGKHNLDRLRPTHRDQAYSRSEEGFLSREGLLIRNNQKGDRRESERSNEFEKSGSSFLNKGHVRESGTRFKVSGKSEHFVRRFLTSSEIRNGFRGSNADERIRGRFMGAHTEQFRQIFADSDEGEKFGRKSEERDESGRFRGKLIRSDEHIEFVGNLALDQGNIGIGLVSRESSNFRRDNVGESHQSRSFETKNSGNKVAYILGSVEDDRVLGDYILNTEYSVITKKFSDINEREKFIADVLKSGESIDEENISNYSDRSSDSLENRDNKSFTVKYRSSEEGKNIYTVNFNGDHRGRHSNRAQFRSARDDQSFENLRSSTGLRRKNDGTIEDGTYPSDVSGFAHSSERGVLLFAKKGLGPTRDRV